MYFVCPCCQVLITQGPLLSVDMMMIAVLSWFRQADHARWEEKESWFQQQLHQLRKKAAEELQKRETELNQQHEAALQVCVRLFPVVVLPHPTTTCPLSLPQRM